MKLLFVVSVFCTILCTLAHPAEKSESQSGSKVNAEQKKQTVKVTEAVTENQEKKSNAIKADSTKKENLKGAESVYHSLPMPFVHYPFPFVNSYTTRYFPYGYAGVGADNVLGYNGLGYGGFGPGGLGYGGLGYAFGYGGWF